jgi:hypothetical protein
MTSRLKRLLLSFGFLGLLEAVSVGVFGLEGIGVESCLLLAFAGAWAMEKEE